MDPYAQQPHAPPTPQDYPSSAQRAFGAIAITLGALGVIAGCCGAISNMSSDAIGSVYEQMLANNPQGAALMAQFTEVMRKWRPLLVTATALNCLVSPLLIVAGVFMWRGRAPLRPIVWGAIGANILAELFVAIVNYLSSQEIQEITLQILQGPGQAPGLSEATRMGSIIGGICGTLGMLAVKWALYVAMAVVAKDRPNGPPPSFG